MTEVIYALIQFQQPKPKKNVGQTNQPPPSFEQGFLVWVPDAKINK